MKHVTVVIPCVAGVNSVILPVFDPCRPVACKTATSAAPGTNKAVDIKPVGGNTMLSGSLNATAKGVSDLVPTTVVADLKQAVTATTGIEVTVTVTNATNVVINLDLDDYLIHVSG